MDFVISQFPVDKVSKSSSSNPLLQKARIINELKVSILFSFIMIIDASKVM